MELKTERILDKPFHLVNMGQALEFLQDKMNQGVKQFIIAQNPEKIMKSKQDKELASIIEERATLLIVDGIGIVIAGKILGLPTISRVTGVGMFTELLKLAHTMQKSVFLYGAKPEVVIKAAEVIKEKHPHVQIAGVLSGYEQDMNEVVAKIEAAKPDFLFVALGSPKQEKWISTYMDRLPVQLVMGVGGSFDVLTGHVKRAPLWMQKMGLEWFHRLITQPLRAKRMLNLPKFLWQVIKSRKTLD